jgi:hypothetical protein
VDLVEVDVIGAEAAQGVVDLGKNHREGSTRCDFESDVALTTALHPDDGARSAA